MAVIGVGETDSCFDGEHWACKLDQGFTLALDDQYNNRLETLLASDRGQPAKSVIKSV